MKKADLNLLVIFDAIMREGSMTRAAEQLATTQPAVSNAVARMRIAWNDPLFVKQGRGIVPTPHAQVMWDRARPHLDDLREMANPEPFDAANARRTFRIGTADINVGLLWRGLRKRAERLARGIDFHAVPNSKADAETQLVDAEVDIAISTGVDQANSHILGEKLLETWFVCAMRPGHPLAAEPLTLDNFAAADHLMVSVTGEATGIIDDLLQQQGRSRRVAMTVNHFTLIPKLLQDSDLITTVPYEAVAEYACRGDLRVMPPPLDIPPITLSMLWHERSDRDAGHLWLRQQIIDIARETRQTLPVPSDCRCKEQQAFRYDQDAAPHVDLAVSA